MKSPTHYLEIDFIAQWIGSYLINFGRVNVTQTKEKYGTVRVYCTLGWYSIHDITHPGYSYSQYPKWLFNLDYSCFSKIVSLFNPIVLKYHQWLYRRAYKKAVQKWPHLTYEILVCADYSEFLKGLSKKFDEYMEKHTN